MNATRDGGNSRWTPSLTSGHPGSPKHGGVGLMIGIVLSKEAFERSALRDSPRAPALLVVDRLQQAGAARRAVRHARCALAGRRSTWARGGTWNGRFSILQESADIARSAGMKHLLSVESMTREDILAVGRASAAR